MSIIHEYPSKKSTKGKNREHAREVGERVHSLISSLEGLKSLVDETIVLKIDDEVIENKASLKKVVEDIVFLKQMNINIVVMHDGRGLIEEYMKKYGFRFSGDKSGIPSAEMEEMILSGVINRKIVGEISSLGGSAIGVSGRDCNLILAKKSMRAAKKSYSNVTSMPTVTGVGTTTYVNPELLTSFEDTTIIPVIAPIGVSANDEVLILDADEMAKVMACSIAATTLVIAAHFDNEEERRIMTERPSFDLDQAKIVLHRIQAQGNLNNMARKIKACIESADHSGLDGHIVDCSYDHPIIVSLLSQEVIGMRISINVDSDF